MATYDRPATYSGETDLSQVVSNAASVAGCTVGQSERGRVGERLLFTETKNAVTIAGNPNAGKYGYSMYHALISLEEMEQFYFARVINGATYATVIVNKEGSSEATSKFSKSYKPDFKDALIEPYIDVTDEEIASGDLTVGPYTKTVSNFPILTIHGVSVDGNALNNVTVDAENGTFSATEIEEGTFNKDTGEISIEFKAGSAPANGASIKLSYAGSSADAVGMVFADNQGAWGNNIKIAIEEVDTTDHEFNIIAYEMVDGVAITRLSKTVSRQIKKDGNSKQMFAEDVLNDNNIYIRYLNVDDQDDVIDPATTLSPVSLSGGDDGSVPTTSQIVQAWELFSNPDDVDVRLLLDGGYVSDTDWTVQSKIESICKARRDCFGVYSVPYEKLSMSPTTDLTDWRRNTQNFNTSFGSLIAPWAKVSDTYNDRNIEISLVGFHASVIARTHRARDAWVPPAGITRGQLVSGVLPFIELTHRYEDGEKNILYKNQVNYAQTFPGDGTCVFGQKTLQTKSSATDRLNVRFLIIVTEKSAKQFLKFKLFELNNESTRADITEALTRYFDRVKARDGVYDFKVVCDETNNPDEVVDNNELHVDVYMQPQKAAEFIRYQSVITRTGVTFADSIVSSI